ncbi:MAG TPA: hypothetical protein VHE61_01175 [Opitutaceae bacterium]|nr:hypothetical protein [Opitutaceae bacterium]
MHPIRPPRLALAVLAVCAVPMLVASNIGRRFPPEMRVFVDKVTGIPITALTTDPANDAKIYQTHPQWTADGKWIIFRSNRGSPAVTETAAPGASRARPRSIYEAFAVNETTGEIVQLTDGPHGYSGMLNVARKSMKLYFLRYPGEDAPAQMIELNLEKLLADSAAGKMQPQSAYERICGTLPAGMRDSGGFSLDADEKYAYIGVRGGDCGTHLPPGTKIVTTQPGQRMGAGPAGLRSMNLETGEVKVIIDTPFLMGHVQANPWVEGEIVYCHETGGDAPQRMWTVRADGSGNRPLYVEDPTEWITHEAIVTRDEVMFSIMAHLPRLQTRPTGLAVINLRTNVVRILGQAPLTPPDRGFWHVNGSPDGRWAVGDTFAGNLYLIDRRDDRMTLLTTGHVMKPDHAHPTFSPDSRRILIQSGLLTGGKSLDLMVVPIPADLLEE